MSPVIMAISVLCLYMVFYRFYAKGVLTKRVLTLIQDVKEPEYTFRDDVDYLPSNKHIRFIVVEISHTLDSLKLTKRYLSILITDVVIGFIAFLKVKGMLIIVSIRSILAGQTY